MDDAKVRAEIEQGRRFLHANWELRDGAESDQDKGTPPPAQQKEAAPGALTVALVPPEKNTLGAMSIIDALRSRRSRRKFTPGSLTLEELSFLLWATQGVQKRTPKYTLRPVPSGGARHSFETYLYLARVEGIPAGLYRYQPLDHLVVQLEKDADIAARIDEALFEQYWNAAAVFVWTTIPYRMEWRYLSVSHKVIALDAGHVCQNLYLACEAIGCGTCGLGAYDQEKLDRLIGVDGRDEFAIYAAPVGRRAD
jgi:SagB-type dehydrogenase family enzyme